MGGDTLRFDSLPHHTWMQGRSDELDLGKYFSEPTVGTTGKIECRITHIRATGVTTGLRRIPVGFYTAINSENVTKRTSNKPVSVGKDVVEWDDVIVLPLDLSSTISLTVFASFELGPTLGAGEVLRRFEITVGGLLDRTRRVKLVRFSEESDEVTSSRSSLEIEIERRVYGPWEYTAAFNFPEPEMCQLGEMTDRGHHALTRYRELGERRDLEESVSHFEYALELCPVDHHSRATVLFNLATAKLIHCRVNDVSPDLDLPIDLYRAALCLRPRGHPDHAFTLLSLGITLKARFQRQQDEADRTESETLLSQVLDVALENSCVYLAAVLALGTGSIAKSELIRWTEVAQTIENDLDDSEEVERLDAAMQRIIDPDPCRPALLDHVGIIFRIRFGHPSHLADPEQAVSVLEVVVQLAPDNHPDKSSWLNSLGNLLLTRYQRTKYVGDLAKSVSVLEDAARLISIGHRDQPSRLNPDRALDRYESFGNVDDLERSISMLENAVRVAYNSRPDRPIWLDTLGNSLLARYKRSGDVCDLGKSILIFEEAARHTPIGHPDKPLRLSNIGNAMLTLYECLKDICDLGKAISMFEEAVQHTPVGHPDKPLWLIKHGDSLMTLYECLKDICDLGKAISVFEDAARLTPIGHPDKPSHLIKHGNSLMTLYECLRDICDLEKAVSVFEEAVQMTPDSHLDKPSRLNKLGEVLLTRFVRMGDIVDLERSISVLEDAVQLAPGDHPDKPSYLTNLGKSLRIRFDNFRDVIDLERSISVKEDAARLMQPGHQRSLRDHVGDFITKRILLGLFRAWG